MEKGPNARCLDPFIQNFRVVPTKAVKGARLKALPDPSSQTVVKEKIVSNRQAHGQHFLCFEKMPEIGSGIAAADGTIA